MCTKSQCRVPEKTIYARTSTSHSPPMDAVMAQTLSISLDDIERIDRMIATAEVRRNAILREVDRHRTTWGQELRRAAQQAEEAGFKLIEAQSDRTKTAA